MAQEQGKRYGLGLDSETRAALWSELTEIIEGYIRSVEKLPVAPALSMEEVRGFAESFRFEQQRRPDEVLREVAEALQAHAVHTPHPRYFGLFNPAPSTMSIAADALVAAFNPQIAAWSHSPLAAEIERHLILSIAGKLGLPAATADGVFTTGGAEANQTAVLAALNWKWPQIGESGVRGLERTPVFYVSAEGHHSFLKAARACGLGADSLREVPAGEDLRMDMDALREMIARDREAGMEPFLLVATAGTTGAGVIDPLAATAEVASANGMWFHADAAWGGAACLDPALRGYLAGIEAADSITFDAHKWLSVSMGAGMFLTRHADILTRCFSTMTAYMPRDARGMAVVDPFTHSIQWSRRFIGLKLFLTLAVSGWDGYAEAIHHQAEMGDELRRILEADGWRIVNRTPLPLVCFDDAARVNDAETAQAVADAVVRSGQAWISTIRLGREKRPALRACITHYATERRHLEELAEALGQARETLGAGDAGGGKRWVR